VQERLKVAQWPAGSAGGRGRFDEPPLLGEEEEEFAEI